MELSKKYEAIYKDQLLDKYTLSISVIEAVLNTQNEVPSEFILDQITEQIERLKTEEQELLDLYSKKDRF
ncbi:hypothetical protein A5881_003880 [Enterococcus termitis]|nr:hypothetical protein A5881_003734 [Enterococcus termitis]